MRLSDFDYDLPDALIAREPLAERDASRLLVLPRSGGPPTHRAFRDLPDLLSPGDLMVFNDARVIPARLRGRKVDSGGRVELLLVEKRPSLPGEKGERWYGLGQASKSFRVGQKLEFGASLTAEVTGVEPEGGLEVRLSLGGDGLVEALWELGEIPLPPYLRAPRRPARTDPNAARYQTIFARRPGASAAPTAGLHFTAGTVDALSRRGIERATVTLFVGPGTFLPVRSEDLSRHHMHEERYEIPSATVEAVSRAQDRGGRVVAVGTTSLRALEAASDGKRLRAGEATTDLFITPGYEFRTIDALVTNFHLPKSTLLMLVCALAGRERILSAYAEAIRERYRFFSYGDAMLVV